jgi:hypothetical protein
MDNIQEEEYECNNFPAISFIRIGIGLTQHFFQEEEEQEEQEEQEEEQEQEPIETMTYYKKMHKLYHELKNRK